MKAIEIKAKIARDEYRKAFWPTETLHDLCDAVAELQEEKEESELGQRLARAQRNYDEAQVAVEQLTSEVARQREILHTVYKNLFGWITDTKERYGCPSCSAKKLLQAELYPEEVKQAVKP